MASASYIGKRKAEAVRRGRMGVAARRARMLEQAAPLRVVGGIHTSGCLGEHHIELLDGGDESRVWIRVDGSLRTPRTLRGVVRVLSGWIFGEVGHG